MLKQKEKKEIPFYVETPYYLQNKVEEPPKKKSSIWFGFLLALGKIGSKAAPVIGKLLKGAKLALSLFGVMWYFQHIPEVSLAKQLLGI